jgi:hypothetical protein
MHPRISYCYTEKRETKAPEVVDGLWLWKGLPGDWGYPMSVDGHIYRTSQLKPVINSLNFSNPNTFEGILDQHRIDLPYMVCLDNSPLLNIPVNKVQTANGNHCGSISAEYLNEVYLSGRQISLSNISGFENISAHQEIPLIFEQSI